jgi:aldehyde dehydrogenase (NAD+)
MLLKQKFDYIFFTGSVEVGKIVMAAAAKRLIPVTLELGGKSPTIVHKDANLQLAARRIAFGKFLNAGQTCVAPDYIYIHSSVTKDFLIALKEEMIKLYGKSPLENQGYTRIVSKRHFERLAAFLKKGVTEIGGKIDETKLRIEPTVLTEINWTMPVMQEEIFGPILPVMQFDTLEEVITEIISRPKPLALYLFTESKEVERDVLSKISFGGGCVNDTLFHLTNPHLPFGGVGESGIGCYHGKSSFETFTHQKSIVKQTTKFDISVRYDSSKKALDTVRKFLK